MDAMDSNSKRQNPIDHPCVWRGDQLSERPDWIQQLSDQEQEEFGKLLSQPDMSLAPALTEHLKQIQHSLEHGSGAVWLKGLQFDGADDQSLQDAFLAMSCVVGTPLSQSATGERVFSVRNAGYAENDPRARGPNTNKKLSFHTDRCDVIGFLCIQPAISGGENQVVSSAELFNVIQSRRPDLLQILMQPYHYQRHTVDTANDLPFTLQPIFSFYEGHFAANFLRVLIERAHANPELPDMSDEQREALDYLEQVAGEEGMHLTFRQQRGDVLFLNNWVTLHRRTEFQDDPDPQNRRHILRVWLSMPNSRPLDPMFAGNYGETAAGAIRGGMRAANPDATTPNT